SRVMEKLGIEEGEAIEHSMITSSVERAQKKVEENNFGIRKRLLEYDNVMNQQREVIYSRRKQALEGERLKAEVLEYLEEYIDGVVEKHYEAAEIDQLRETILQHLLVDFKFEPKAWQDLGKDGVKEKLVEAATDFYSRKEEMLGSELMSRLEQYAVLSVTDNKWREHLREMDDLKEGIGLRAYGQKDPLLEYKGEAYNLFVNLLGDLRNEVVSFCFKFWPQAPAEVQNRRTTPTRMQTIKDSADNLGLRNQPAEGSQAGKAKPIRVEEKTGRNEPCPCGSGKKFKNCHGLTA
ncbi:MAG: SEC-C metal-binding domain-containing protein, partial [Ignavibacteria bacterium]|nr:SEC-C metal-binding domain-containing protein [Ignavibacteria bacterium]